ncbi:methylated-DNA--[protein]-cysteine S-methyltransferase [Alginatibacterium sediminis]|uniref:methylated-DNA--[protein]-cysteine S-methyltransferase n=1 Tax=Alginatibacterium sediminis TaxID=2164068 RepID=A0A420E8L1_9ALTE|nr:methylated-DNA--[protein]-cysteine S-methyltransferase [Alginatibacterium sediminis]RKF15717.1 methylated-DNA--[protein]-cysteine S-methyltransferase [Alginatibacterium sediminis]
MPMPANAEMLKAIQSRDALFDGQFYYGVVTTGVFCQPSCSSKMANPENIRLLPNIESALQSGFRPCKRCCPAGPDQKIQKLVDVARYIEQHLDDKLSLASLGTMVQLSGSRLQRVFKEAFGVSPKHYQDAIRMRHFKHSLKQGEPISDAIYAAGFGSSSRVYGEASRNIGMTPKAYRDGGNGETIHYACRNTTFGHIIMAATTKGVCSVQFADNESELLPLLSKEFPKATLLHSTAQNSPALDNWIHALDQHLNQGTAKPELPLDIRGTTFQIKVWQCLLSIKEGEVMSYGDVAANIDQPKAVRAVGTACGKNPVGVLIPCHRVLRADGSLGGYRWGEHRKQTLLAREKPARKA